MGKKFTNFTINLDGLDQKEQWYTIITKHNYEQFVIERMLDLNNKLGIISDAFTPVEETISTTTTKTGKAKQKVVAEKLMPNYVFIKTRLTVENWRLIMSITGVSSMLCVSGTPVAVSEKDIQNMKGLINLQTA